jgi:hypothetical protein
MGNMYYSRLQLEKQARLKCASAEMAAEAWQRFE